MMNIARGHNSTVTLSTGEGFTIGGGLCGQGCVANHQGGAILSPPYSFGAEGMTPALRPTLIATSSSTVPLGTNVVVNPTGATKSFELVRLHATTHAINTDQRRVPLTIVAAAASAYALAIPADPCIVVPGCWMLFAMDANGTPSIAKIIRVKS